jgi:hypothetical protein
VALAVFVAEEGYRLTDYRDEVSGLNWIAENLKILTKDGKLRLLEPNVGQMLLHNTMNLQWLAGLPVRIILLKPRQVGWSTWCAATHFERIYRNENRTCQVVSADLNGTNQIFRMCQIFDAELPPRLKRPKDSSNRKEIVYSAPHRSRIITQTAGTDILGRGPTVHHLHCSEFSMWENERNQFGSVSQQVPELPDTSIIIESTANGMGGGFYDMYQAAKERLRKSKKDYRGFLPVFFPWFKFPEYQIEPPSDYEWKYDDEEKYLLTLKLSPAQLYWRRVMIEGKCGGDINFFKQEYPANDLEAFQQSGRNVFSHGWMDKLFRKAYDGVTGLFIDGKFEKMDISDDCWEIFSHPISNHQYAMGIDTAEGSLSNMKDSESAADFHGVVIFDRESNKVVAQYHGRCEQSELGDQCLQAALYYNKAWVGPEIPNGKVVLDSFRLNDYPNIYQRSKNDDHYEPSETEQLGWRTTSVTRPWMVEAMLTIQREDEIQIPSKSLIEEMRTFIRDKTGKPIHRPGKHDDLLFALMIAIQVHQRTPMTSAVYQYAFTGVRPKQGKSLDSLAYVGAVDNGEDMFTDGVDECFTR